MVGIDDDTGFRVYTSPETQSLFANEQRATDVVVLNQINDGDILMATIESLRHNFNESHASHVRNDRTHQGLGRVWVEEY